MDPRTKGAGDCHPEAERGVYERELAMRCSGVDGANRIGTRTRDFLVILHQTGFWCGLGPAVLADD
jgi:hypothetical protein